MGKQSFHVFDIISTFYWKTFRNQSTTVVQVNHKISCSWFVVAISIGTPVYLEWLAPKFFFHAINYFLLIYLTLWDLYIVAGTLRETLPPLTHFLWSRSNCTQRVQACSVWRTRNSERSGSLISKGTFY